MKEKKISLSLSLSPSLSLQYNAFVNICIAVVNEKWKKRGGKKVRTSKKSAPSVFVKKIPLPVKIVRVASGVTCICGRLLVCRRRMVRLISGACWSRRKDRVRGLSGIQARTLVVRLVGRWWWLVLMLWRGWAATTSPLEIAAAVSLGGLCWAAALVLRRHPIIAEVTLLWNKVRARPSAAWRGGTPSQRRRHFRADRHHADL